MNEPLVSVIVPVYKVGKYLDKCVESIVSLMTARRIIAPPCATSGQSGTAA